MSSRVSNEALELYKFAAQGMYKKADMKSDLATALAGAVLGGGVGYLADKATPTDEDEDKKNRLLTNVLTGAAMGGLGGYGVSRLGKRLGGLLEREDWFQRNWPEFGWRHVYGAGAVGSGYYVGKHIQNEMLNRHGPTALKNVAIPKHRETKVIFNTADDLKKILDEGDPIARTALYNAQGAADIGWRERLKLLLSRKARRQAKDTQRALDAEVLKNLFRLTGKTDGRVSPSLMSKIEKLVQKSKFNPRKIIQAGEAVKNGRKAALRAGKYGGIAALAWMVANGLKD